MLLLVVGVVLQWCADVPVLGCAVVCRRWSPAVAAARQRARGGAGASVAQSSGGEHGSQAPAHTEHTVMVTLGHSSPRPRAGAAVKHSRGPGRQALSEAVEVPGWRLVRVHVQCEGEGGSSGPAISCAAQPQPACGL